MVSARQRDDIDKLYKTPRWRKIRLVIIARDFGLCQECKRRGIITKGTIVHHKVEARDDITMFWNENNLELACVACHNKEHPERSGGTKKAKTKANVVKFYATNER
ncbi:HNH endonuclease [Enterococcus sp. BWR-S5]|uniref:HNH endonuclease n=1 Tax=Enterococcus sp. BWR-S5 TaxID=2787714 RepID=UPI001924BB4A|nr:HNH endonuclease [Enterococcus sp. BWR-S5]